MQDSVWLMTTLGLFAFFSLVRLLEQTPTTAKSLKRWSLIWALAAVLTYFLGTLLKKWVTPTVAQELTLLTGPLWAASAGLSIGELIAELRDSKLRWTPYNLWLIYFIFYFGLQQAPLSMGSTRATLDTDLKTSTLPVMAPLGSTDESWRLVTSIDGKFLLVRLSPNPKERVFRLLDSTEAWEIHTPK